jgi:hypothetical protein
MLDETLGKNLDLGNLGRIINYELGNYQGDSVLELSWF